MKKFFVLAAALAIVGGEVAAQEYPSKTIEVITHAGNGGGTDVTTRMMMIRARRELGTDMVVVNKRGGGGASAMDYYLTQGGRWAQHSDIHYWTLGHCGTGQNRHVVG